MSITPLFYDLPDASLLRSKTRNNQFLVWRPTFTSIVLGFSNKVENSLHVQAVESADLAVYRRPSGGETVLLSANTLVVSLQQGRVKWQPHKLLFGYYNNIIIKALISLGIGGLREAGFSDITLNGKKICGSAIYQNREKIFFHAVINVRESVLLLERYIKHPARQPAYRANRRHGDFVTSIFEQGYQVEPSLIELELRRQLQAIFADNS